MSFKLRGEPSNARFAALDASSPRIGGIIMEDEESYCSKLVLGCHAPQKGNTQ